MKLLESEPGLLEADLVNELTLGLDFIVANNCVITASEAILNIQYGEIRL